MNINENKWIENHTEDTMDFYNMRKPMIDETLFNTERYDVLREKMVDELMEDQMAMPTHTLLSMLEEFVWDMFHNMDDDQLQDMFDNLKQDEVDPDGITDMFEPTVVEDKTE